jgi:pimeloyl-ACP methyl ester carboxylesterase
MARRVSIVLVVLVVVVLAMLWSLQRRLIYFPSGAVSGASGGAQDVGLETDDGLRLTAWLVRPSAPDRRVAVLVAPGNAGNRAGRLPLAAALAADGFTALLVDYRGYGGNPGSPAEDGLARDARAAWSYLTGAFAADRIILFGESLGAAVVTRLAADLPGPAPRGLVLRSPFASLASVGRAHYPFLPVGTLLRDRYEVAKQISGVSAPTVVVYGTADSIVPPAQSRTVADAAGNLLTVIKVDGADHNDAVLAAGPPVLDAVRRLAPPP